MTLPHPPFDPSILSDSKFKTITIDLYPYPYPLGVTLGVTEMRGCKINMI